MNETVQTSIEMVKETNCFSFFFWEHLINPSQVSCYEMMDNFFVLQILLNSLEKLRNILKNLKGDINIISEDDDEDNDSKIDIIFILVQLNMLFRKTLSCFQLNIYQIFNEIKTNGILFIYSLLTLFFESNTQNIILSEPD